MCELCKLGLFCVEMAKSVTGVLFKNKRFNLQKVLLAVGNDPCGQKPGLKSQPLELSLLGVCSIGKGAEFPAVFPSFPWKFPIRSLMSCLASDRSDKIAA